MISMLIPKLILALVLAFTPPLCCCTLRMFVLPTVAAEPPVKSCCCHDSDPAHPSEPHHDHDCPCKGKLTANVGMLPEPFEWQPVKLPGTPFGMLGFSYVPADLDPVCVAAGECFSSRPRCAPRLTPSILISLYQTQNC